MLWGESEPRKLSCVRPMLRDGSELCPLQAGSGRRTVGYPRGRSGPRTAGPAPPRPRVPPPDPNTAQVPALRSLPPPQHGAGPQLPRPPRPGHRGRQRWWGGGRESGRGRAGPGLTASPRRDRTRRGRGAVQGRSASNGAEPHRGGPGEPRTRGTDGPDPPPPPRTPPAPRGAAEPGPRRSAPGSNRCAWTWPTGTPRRRRWARRGPSSCW